MGRPDMTYTTYILKSIDRDWYYTGHTSDMKRRLSEHNLGRNKATKPYKPFRIVYEEHFSTKGDAFGREMQIKKYRHGEAFKKLIDSYCRVV